MAWTSKPEWAAPIIPEQQLQAGERFVKQFTDIYGTETNPVALDIPPLATAINAVWQSKRVPELTAVDLAIGERVILTSIEDGAIIHKNITKEYKNKVPTHDPYTNPDSHIYYQCDCGAILDPGTRSFASLNNHASDTGWKVRWRQCGNGYQAFCVKCGEGIE